MLSAGKRDRKRGIWNPERGRWNPWSGVWVPWTPEENVNIGRRLNFRRLDFHPAELSGPSKDPRLQLMELPAEVRNQIFRLVMISQHKIRLDSSGRFRPVASPPEIAPALLGVCRQAYHETRSMLYQENKWLITHMQAFAELFIEAVEPPFVEQIPDTLGENRAMLLRDLVIWPGLRDDEHSYPHEPKLQIQQVTRFVFSKLLGLQHLQLVWLGRFSSGAGRDDSAQFLREAAYITSQHPILKKAIWNRKSGRRPKNPWFDEVLMAIDFVAESRAKPSFELPKCEQLEDDFSRQLEGITEKDLILNCLKIRKAAWAEVSLPKLEDFALPGTASSSEPY
ncbi:hypothetical protein H2200_007224 [Cladophialophora chaetospira]|uniref:Uncharacterized protein n=1 Tax=Cladophialophora chaetospira TaxID=386627 RepID=A0AA38X7X5_9EURO|nr:hypothetical protein H2200_007224 [Cladophialophora chaetospira]